MFILGISAWFHDSAACLIVNGEIVAAAQEERFTRIKHDSAFPVQAIKYCLDFQGINSNQIEAVVFNEKPFLKFERILETYLAFAPKGFWNFSKSMPLWVKDKLFQKVNIVKNLQEYLDEGVDWNLKLKFSEHHLSHAASAFYPSPYEKAAVLTMDGVGEWTTTSLAIGSGNDLKIVKEIHFPHSIGLLYSAFTYYLGFKVNSGEYKVMGLAPYGEPVYAEKIKSEVISIKSDGSYQLNLKYFDFCTGSKMTNKKFEKLFGLKTRKSEADLTQDHMNMAASIQRVTEEVVLLLAADIHKTTGMENLCLAGGVALNCVANGILEKAGIFKNIWIQPASGDAGGSLGAALAYYYLEKKAPREISPDDSMKGSLLGPSFNDDQIKSALDEVGASYSIYDESELDSLIAEQLAAGKAVGWMQGRMEFGPRALGARSIIADPRSELMQKNLNLKIKFRESFRPFAPSVLAGEVSNWFDIDTISPYMLMVAKVAENCLLDVGENLTGLDKLNQVRSAIPAVTHVNNTARIQTVDGVHNNRYHSLINEFYKLTGCPILINTSFNVRGEPIVCTPEDAFNCFMGTNLDYLVIDNFVLAKTDQSQGLVKSYKDKYELD
ncbi:carbamoyltransferase family protein [Pseudomonas sp. HK3]